MLQTLFARKTRSAHRPRKLAAIRSYANFCEGRGDPAYPLEIFLEVSNICDLKCAMCVEFSALNAHRLQMIKRKERGFLATEEMAGNLDAALRHALVVHCFGYGEPTIHPQFRELIAFVSRYEVMIDFFTNGMHLDEDLCRFLVDSGIAQITVSFSGATKEMYESIYLGGHFETVLGGIKRIADLKAERGLRYPIIEINSLGFKDHVAQFDTFVEVMAAHGANVIHLKRLQPHKVIPQLYEHVSVMRPDIEGPIIARAEAAAARLGVTLSTGLYTGAGASSEAEYDARIGELREDAAQTLGANRGFGENPISAFRDIAKATPLARAAPDSRESHRALSLDAEAEVASALLQIEQAGDALTAPGFHCMEPYKTLYVTRNGAAKPCCFANPHGWYLGDVTQADALDVWRGAGYGEVRGAIADGRYPLTACGTCLHNKSGPRGHFAHMLIGHYLLWHALRFGPGLALRAAARFGRPGVIKSTGAQIMARARRTSTRRPPAPPTPGRAAVIFVPEKERLLHPDCDVTGVKLAPDVVAMAGMTTTNERRLLFKCARDHYRGEGMIVDLGMFLGASAAALAAGLRANRNAAAAIAERGSRGQKPIVGFERGALTGDPHAVETMRHKFFAEHDRGALAERGFAPELEQAIAGYSDLIDTRIGDVVAARWSRNAPVEICFVDIGGARKTLSHVVRQFFPAFIPGRTLLVQRDFYSDRMPYTKVLMGFLAPHFEWLGQINGSAVFRYVTPIGADKFAVDPLHDFKTEVCARLHRATHDPRLSPERLFRLEVSLSELLAHKDSPGAAAAHLDDTERRFSEIVSRQPYAGMMARARTRLAAASADAVPELLAG